MCTIVIRTCDVIAEHLLPRYVRVPSGNQLQEIVNEFETLWGFPQAVGAIDGSHMPILKPRESPSDYFNRKGFYSILVQAVVDSRGRFMDVTIGWPGKVHDARVLVNSTFYQRGISGELLPDWKRIIDGVEIPLMILGDPAYLLLPWLMKPYRDTGSNTPQQRHFNYRQSRARMVVENAFGRLKGRWRCLLKRMDYYKTKHTIDVIASCIVLHNICELRGDACDLGWIIQEDFETTSNDSTASNTSSSSSATNIRNTLAKYLYDNQ